MVCCFFGHRTICETEELKTRLREIIKRLIEEENVDTFLFGSKSRFNDLCYELVNDCKNTHPDLKRVYVRGEYPCINDRYEAYLLEKYEATYFPEKALGAGKAIYVERNYEMIRKSDICVVYYDEKFAPATRKSGTKIALDYAVRQKKRIIKV